MIGQLKVTGSDPVGRCAALVADLTDRLHAHDSWAGETHIQKGVFLLQELLGVPTEVEYELFKHGPFSFQLREELGEMRSEDVLTLVPQRPPYGPRFYTDEATAQLREQFPKTLKKYAPQLEWIAEWMPSEILGLRRRTAARGVFRLIHRSRIALRGATRFARGLSR